MDKPMSADDITSIKTTVFISHANPEDNYFSAWLAAKLSLMGYEVWCDVEELKGGEDAWTKIERAIREDTIKFIFVTSSHSIKKGGTLKELAVADRVRGIEEFIIPIRIDDVSFDDLPAEIIRLIAIDFSQNWASGLKQLSEKLESHDVPAPKIDVTSGMLPFWYKTISVDDHEPLEKPENYLSNWFDINLPPKIYAHIPDFMQVFDYKDIPYPIFRDQGYLLTFASADSLTEYIKISQTEEIPIEDFLENRNFQPIDMNFTIKDTNQKLIRLLNDAFEQHMPKMGLETYELSGRRKIFFFPKQHTNTTVSLKKYGRRSSQLYGKVKGDNWHFAIEAQSFLYPVPAYFLTYHVVFSNNGVIIDNKRKQHSLRRSLGKNWFNRKWRDALLASMLAITPNQDDVFKIPVCKTQDIKVSTYPIILESPVGYKEPRKGDSE